MKYLRCECLIVLQMNVVLLLMAVAQAGAMEPAKIAHAIKEGLESRTDRLPWEGVFTQQRVLRGRTLYISKEQWAELSDSRHTSGASVAHNNMLVLAKSEELKSASHKYFVVPWAKRVYLVEEERIFQFVDAVNSGAEPCKESPGQFFVRVDLLSEEIKGKPALPENLQKFVFDKPFRGKLIRILDRREGIDIANYGWIAAGLEIEILPDESKPVFVGMTLRSEDSAKSYQAIVTRTADENSKSFRAVVPSSLILGGGGPAKDDYLVTRQNAKIK